MVLWNGLHLEAQMIDQLESLGEAQLAVGDQIPEDLLLGWEKHRCRGQRTARPPHLEQPRGLEAGGRSRGGPSGAD